MGVWETEEAGCCQHLGGLGQYAVAVGGAVRWEAQLISLVLYFMYVVLSFVMSLSVACHVTHNIANRHITAHWTQYKSTPSNMQQIMD